MHQVSSSSEQLDQFQPINRIKYFESARKLDPYYLLLLIGDWQENIFSPQGKL